LQAITRIQVKARIIFRIVFPLFFVITEINSPFCADHPARKRIKQLSC
jgi:hypothetical protein